MQKIRWIHFSDLHFGNDKAVDTRLMRQKLPEYIAGLNQTFDYAFCSGDIKEWNADYSVAPEYIRRLCSAAHTPLEHLFVVPGNHDVERGGDDRTELIDRITDWKTDYYKSNDGGISCSDYVLLKSGQAAFCAFISDLLGAERAEKYKTPHFAITTDYLNILHLDTTLTYGAGHDRDFVIGTQALMDALDKCDSSKPTIILTHYSFDFLTMSERDQIETILNTYHVQLWIAGHEHENLIRWQREKFIECQSGNLALQMGARSCFLTGEIDLDTGDGAIFVHAWYEGKNWELYPFARNGSEDDRVFPFQLSLSGRSRAYDVSAELANAREACDNLTSSGGLFADVSVNTTILPDLEVGSTTYCNNEAEYPLTRVMDKLWTDHMNQPELSCNALILGDGGMGKSTMMFCACRQLLSNRRLAVYISLQAREGANNESLVDYILRCLYKATDERAKNKLIQLTASCHPCPDLVLFIDGFNELSGEGMQRYVSEIKTLSQHSGIQIIVSSRLDFLRDYGLSYFGMIRTCELREEQIQQLFTERPDDWSHILSQKNLRILLGNPMMALLYASTCPIVERHADLDYLDWITPINNASDLLHDYYMAQVAILLDKSSIDSNRIFDCMVAIDRVLPSLAYSAERRNTTAWTERDFEAQLRDIITETNATSLQNPIPEKLQRIKRRLRVHKDSVGDLYDLIISEMVLLKSGNGRISFAHQVFRDYLAAVYLHNCLIDNISVERLWHEEEINKGVVQYLRFIGNESTWGTTGAVTEMLRPYRGKEAVDGDKFVSNVINCWLSIGDGERDLSSLDLRKVSLSEHLKTRFTGTINIDNAWISKETLINDRHHDRIVGIRFSHDNRTMAAVSQNGIVSITNLLTQSQMIVGELTGGADVQIGFDTDDFLIVRIGQKAYKWSTIAYDKIEEGDANKILSMLNIDDDMSKRITLLKNRLRESNLDGIIRQASENGRYLAVGFESGFIQVWDVIDQDCVANLSLCDSQIATIAFTKDGRIAALGSGGRLVQIWDMTQNKCIQTLYFPQRVSMVRLPADGHTLECQFSDLSYYKVDLRTGERTKVKRPDTKPFISKALLKRLKGKSVLDIQSTSGGNAIILTEKGQAFTWDEKLKRLNDCPGHRSRVQTIAMCTADDRFAASYSAEKYTADRNDRDRRGLLNNQKLVRVRIVKTGQCQWRLPTNGRAITKLQFFTSNRIILAGFATNGDILLWELINEIVHGEEHGRWESVEIVRNNQAEPMECAFPDDKTEFISAYTDGTILIRPFTNRGSGKKVATLPGIDAGVLRWENLMCNDQLKLILNGYQHQR